jgi:protein TonB
VNDSSEIGENIISPRNNSEETAENTLLSQSGKEETAEGLLLGNNFNPNGESSPDSSPAENATSTESSETPPEPPPKKEPTIEYEDPEISPPSILPEIQKVLHSDVRNSSIEETYAIKSVQENSASGDSITAALPEGETNAPKETVKMGDLVPLTQVDSEPEPIKKVQPEYPPSAMAFNVQGQLVVNTLISENGDVLKTIIIRRIKNSRGLNESGEKAIQQWKFKPAIKDGVPVKVWKPISIAFKKEK